MASIILISIGEAVKTGRMQGSDVGSGVGDGGAVGVAVWVVGGGDVAGGETGGGVVVIDADGAVDVTSVV
ncbi:MAG: hypothetical protein A2Y58_02265 [Chloroflexi bacterium RBG_13_51_52]|nr:MAG: hypothetical protein A2Y58_02265 [Chloroflexi bacterium RBG_13_51_52]